MNTNKYLKGIGDGIVVTNRGIEEYVVTKYVETESPNVETIIKTKEEAVKKVASLPSKVATLSERVGYNPLEYGCGCEKGDSNVCKKHGRV